MRNDLEIQFDSQIIRWSYNKRVKRTFLEHVFGSELDKKHCIRYHWRVRKVPCPTYFH